MKKLSIQFIALLFAGLSVTAWAAEDLEIVNGNHWIQSSIEQKRAFLFGVGNILEIEEAMAGDNFDALRGRSIVPVLLEGLSGTPITDIVTQLDKFYTEHPKQLNRAVIEVMYMEMASPRMKK